MPIVATERAIPGVKQPWQSYPTIWKTEAAFWAYVRGGVRLIWSRYPAKLEWKKKQMTPVRPESYTGKGKTFGQCHYCKATFVASALEVDHVEQAGSCNSWETFRQFTENLLDTNDNWVLACKPCHKVKSYAERTGKNFEEALIEKRVIEFMKKSKDEVVAFCEGFGYNSASLRNAAQRRETLTKIFNKENNDSKISAVAEASN